MAKTRVGFSTPEVCRAVRITQRMANYWVKARLVVPSVHDSRGKGDPNRFDLRDAQAFATLAYLREAGVSLQGLRQVQRYLRSRGYRELQDVSAQLVWAPGNRRYRNDIALVHSETEAESLLREPGQGVTTAAIHVGKLYQQVRERLRKIRSERKAKPRTQLKQRREPVLAARNSSQGLGRASTSN